MAFCSACGNEIKDSVNFCQDCGATQSKSEFIDEPKDWIVTLLLSFFLGCLGVHRFYHHFGRKFQGCARSST